ncbi:MAG: biopolymer transporter ExbD [Oleiphilaceae bacterium]|nr:biopolymer transporter ExbD [Oleiphilaceae bacterium]
MARRKHKRLVQQAELDITAFMNLMIVLVPVLLLSMVFSHTAVLELNFPLTDEQIQQLEENDDFQLQLIVRHDAVAIASSKSGLITRVAKTDEGYDFAKVSEVLQAVKQRVPEKTDITILLEPGIEYQHLVTAMDTSRSYQAVVAANLVDAELFPNVSIGDAPDLNSAGGKS